MKLDHLKKVNRLVIYFFYDGDGIVDRYVPYMLEDINKNCSELFVVCNGKLTPEGRQTFQKLTPNILVRENKGFDVWAYKTALEQYGWDKLAEFDEVVMMNSTIMGPIYPFSEMFEEMNKRDLDFWGITLHHRYDANPFNIEYGYIPKHIQSHFIVVRKSMLSSVEFQNYWDTMQPINSYSDAIGKHEAIFTKRFSDMGFAWQAYCDTSSLEKFTEYPLLLHPVEMLQKHNCPIFKRRSFFGSYDYLLNCSDGSQGKELYEYLKAHTSYDVDLIWENILRTNHLADIKNCMSLNYVLSDELASAPKNNRKIALVIHEYFDDLIEECFRYALSVPVDCDIYITTDSDKKAAAIKKVFEKGPWNKVYVLVIENRGRDVSSLLVGVADKLDSYDYVCFMHDKKVTQLDYAIKGYAFSERCFQNLLGSKELVQNILQKFDENPRLGMLCPPPPNFSDYYPTLGIEWGPNFQATQELHNKLELSCPISLDKEPIAPLGTMFWFRPEALQKLLKYGWKYTDFPKEPNKNDGTVLHAIERIYPFVVQDAGYYSAWVTSANYMRTEWTNLSYMLRNININAFNNCGATNFVGLVRIIRYNPNQIGQPQFRIRLKRKVKSVIPNPAWKFLKKIYHIFGGKKWVG